MRRKTQQYSDASFVYEQNLPCKQAGKYAEARAAYSASIAAQPSHLALANRAMAALKLRDFAAAEADCTAAIELDAAYVKASRRVTLHVQPGSLEAEMAPYCQDGSPYPCFWRPTAHLWRPILGW